VLDVETTVLVSDLGRQTAGHVMYRVPVGAADADRRDE
jgi:hypothetical protein